MEKLEVITSEQMDFFPADVKEQLAYLIKHMSNATEMQQFNPLVSRLVGIKSKVDSLELVKEEDGSFNKANIQEFVDVKKEIRSYRADVKKLVKAFKAPRIAENKAFTAIEKHFIEDATKSFDMAEKKFEAYVEYEAEQKRLREEKKNAALIEAQKKAQQEQEEMRNKMMVSEAYNTIKYERIGGVLKGVHEAVSKFGKDALVQKKNEVLHLTFDSITGGIPAIVMLDDKQIQELTVEFIKTQESCLELIDNRLKSIAEAEKLTIAEAAKKVDEVFEPEAQTVPPPPPQAYTYNELLEQAVVDLTVISNGLREWNLQHGNLKDVSDAETQVSIAIQKITKICLR